MTSRSDMSRHRRRIQRELAESPTWRVRSGDAWVCPYCAELTTPERDADTPDDILLLDAVSAHLAGCLRWREFEGKPLSAAEMTRRSKGTKLKDRIRDELVKSPLWQLYDLSRRWYCPFCAQATDVRVKEGGRISSSVLRQIEGHLRECSSFARGRGEEQPLATLRSIVGYANRTRKMAEKVRQRIEGDAAWRLRDAEGRWVCPFCREVCPEIDFRTPERMTETAPLEIARHLVSRCPSFPGSKPAAEARPEAPEPTAGRAAPPSEIARLGRAPTREVLAFSGAPPLEVSGELRALGLDVPPVPDASASRDREDEAPPFAASLPELDLAPARATPPPAEPEGWRDEIQTRLDEVRVSVAQAAEPRETAGDAPPAAVDGLEIRQFQRLARAQGHDVAEVVSLGPGRVALAVGSVSTDGSDRGLVLPTARGFLRMRAREGLGPAETLALLNDDLLALGDDIRSIAALTYAVLDFSAGEAVSARAGGQPLLIFHPQEGEARRLEGRGAVLGLGRREPFLAALEVVRAPLRRGSMAVLHSHGLTAAESIDHKRLGLETLARLLARYGRHEADYLIYKLERFFEAHTRGAPLADDATALAAREALPA